MTTITLPGMPMLRALWAYRGFVYSSIHREFHGKYRESLLGAFWAVANPLAMILVYTVIFSQLMRASLPGHADNPFAFSIYLCAGVLTWGLFGEMLGRLNTVFLDHGNLIKKANFPRICLPAIVTGSALLNFGIIMALYLVFLLVTGHWPGWVILTALPVLALQLLFTLGLGILLGTVNVFFRDVGQMTGVVLQFWFWLTPIVYTVSSLPEAVQNALAYNPMLPIIASYQGIFLQHQAPNWSSLVHISVLTVALLLVGFVFFMRRVGEMVDEL
ncbi:ABC transporter permease [Limnohabitans sp.]|uniref:ABC transporter permease n=1 Tax=Limnohabitans sp. TaxID=1907725 RepID=UPI0031FDFABB